MMYDDLYEKLVELLEIAGCCTSDAQAVADVARDNGDMLKEIKKLQGDLDPDLMKGGK